ncbi:alcohol dehydrogenase GroES domain-containing protein [Podospora appendiculata]|uniref:Alcohol dehydrogenase GroES domain-containing protein n=1 Tax=Podospora appendiculata TaxID=314037 RepID=A0AAE1CD51_9PEZI|nr:alcohol dehydrogenase GroES domain-containing protein [Podospora appendiculata]
MAPDIPPTYRGLQFTSPSTPATITTLPTPPVTAGTALIRPLRVGFHSYLRETFTKGNPRGNHFPLPIIPGSGCIGRLVSASSDAPSLQTPNQLVLVDPVLRASDRTVSFIHGEKTGPTAAAAAVAAGEWRNGSFAELVRVPAVNVHPLNEDLLLNTLGYSLEDLVYMNSLGVPFGGLRNVDVRPGDLVLVAPATGYFGFAAVQLALAFGASVVAMGRNEQVLKGLEENATMAYPASRLVTAKLHGASVQADAQAIADAARRLGSRDGTVDVFIDMSPPPAGASSHIKAGILALREGGRMGLFGGPSDDVLIPYNLIMLRNLTLRGTFMTSPEQLGELVKLVERGVVKLGEKAGVRALGVFELAEWEEAFRVAGDEAGVGRIAMFAPNGREAK